LEKKKYTFATLFYKKSATDFIDLHRKADPVSIWVGLLLVSIRENTFPNFVSQAITFR
jgi:hypothetical protein